MGDIEASRFASNKRHINTGYAIRGILKMMLRIIGGIILLLILFYFVVLVTTSVRFINTDSYGVVLTKDPKITMGRIPTGTVVLAQPDTNNQKLDSVYGKLELAVLPQSGVSKMTIIGGPDGRLTFDNDKIAFNGRTSTIDKSSAPADFPNRGFLAGKYWVKCTDKNDDICDYSKTYIINVGDIIGQVHGTTNENIKLIWNVDRDANNDENKKSTTNSTQNSDGDRSNRNLNSSTPVLNDKGEDIRNEDVIVQDVIDGKYANGDERKKLLGSRYDSIMGKVNYRCLVQKDPLCGAYD